MGTHPPRRSQHRPAPRWLAGACLLALAGCGDAPSPRAVDSFGRSGLGPGEFSYPRAAAWSPDGRLYIVDKAGRIQAFSATGEHLFGWRMPRIDLGKPVGLCVAPDGRLYVASTHYNEVMVFSPDGQELERFGRQGDGPGQFRLVTDIAITPDGAHVYVGEYGGNDRISRFTREHVFEFSFGGAAAGPGALRRPQGLAIGPDGDVWVADACNHRICRYAPDGGFRAAFGQRGADAGELYFPYSVDFRADGALVVAEYGNNRIQAFTPAGTSLGTWGVAGRGPGELASPWAAAVGPQDRVFALDSGNNRVQVIARDWP